MSGFTFGSVTTNLFGGATPTPNQSFTLGAVQTNQPFAFGTPVVTTRATAPAPASTPHPAKSPTQGLFGNAGQQPALTGANIFSQPTTSLFGTGLPDPGMFSVTLQPNLDNPFSSATRSTDYQHVITLLSQTIPSNHPAMVYLRETPRRELTESVRNKLQPYLLSGGNNIETTHMETIIKIFQAVLNATAKSEEQIKLLQLDERIRINSKEHDDVRDTFLGLLILCFSRAPFWLQSTPTNALQSTSSSIPARSTNLFSGAGPEDYFMSTIFGPLLRGVLINLKEHPFRRSCPPPSSSSNTSSSFNSLSTTSSASSSSSQVNPKITSFLLPLLMFTFHRPPLSHLLIPSIIQLIQAIYVDTDSSHTLTTMTSLPTSVSSIPSLPSSPSSSTSTTTLSKRIPIDDAQLALIQLFQQNPDFDSKLLPLIRLLRQAGATTQFTTNVLSSDSPLSSQFFFGETRKVDTRQVNSWIYLSSWMSTQKLECILQWLIEEYESDPRAITELYEPTFELDLGDGSGSQTILAYVQRLMKLHPNNTPLQIYGQLIHRLHQFTSQHDGSSTTLFASSGVFKNEAELDEEMAINLDALRSLNVASSPSSIGKVVSESVSSSNSTSVHDELGEWLKKTLTDVSISCHSAHLLERLIQVSKGMNGSSSQGSTGNSQNTNGVNFTNPFHRNQFSSSQLEAIHSIMTDMVHLLSDTNRPERLNLSETDAYGNSLFHSLLSMPTHELIRLRPYQHTLFQQIKQLPKQSLVANQATLDKLNQSIQLSFSFTSSVARELTTPPVALSSSSPIDYYPFTDSQKLPSPQYTQGAAFTIGRRFHFHYSDSITQHRYQLIGIQFFLPDGASIRPDISIYGSNRQDRLLQLPAGGPINQNDRSRSGVITYMFPQPIDFMSQPNVLICLSWDDVQIRLDRDDVPPTQLIQQRLVRTPLEEVVYERGYSVFPTKNPPHPTGFNCAPIIRKIPIAVATPQVSVPTNSLFTNQQSQVLGGGAAASYTPPLSFSFGPPTTSSGSTPSFGATASSPAIFGTPAKIEATSFLSLFSNPPKPSADVVVPVDSECPHASTTHVHTEDGTDFDCTLHQPNIGNINNKFYKIQLLATNSSPRNYGVWKRWGREGERGQSQMSWYGTDLTAAKYDFFTKFKDKTKNEWTNRHNFTKEPNKYWYEPQTNHTAITAAPSTNSLFGTTAASSKDISTPPSFSFNSTAASSFNFNSLKHLTIERLFGDALPTAEIHTINGPHGPSYAVGNGATLPLDLLFAYHSPYPANQFIWMIYDLLFTLTLDHLRVTYPKISLEVIVRENLIGHLTAIVGRWSELMNPAELKVWIDLFHSHSIPIANPSVSFGITPLNDIFELWLRGGDKNIHLIRRWLSTCHDSTDGLWPTRAPKLQHESLLETVTRLSNEGNLGVRSVDVIDLLQTETDRWYHIYGPLIKMDVEDHLIPDLTAIIYEYLLPPNNDAASTFASSFLSRSLLSVANHSSFTPAKPASMY